MEKEIFLIRTEGGPHPGDRVANTPGGVSMDWPLPDELPDEGGRYVKYQESVLPPQKPDSPVKRGATYRWEPKNG